MDLALACPKLDQTVWHLCLYLVLPCIFVCIFLLSCIGSRLFVDHFDCSESFKYRQLTIYNMAKVRHLFIPSYIKKTFAYFLITFQCRPVG
jgi:hypothetical protein